MRPFTLLAAAMAIVPGALAVDQQKSAIIFFENDATPDYIIDRAKALIKEAKGKITHTYDIIKGFAVIAPAAALENLQVQTWASDNRMVVEEDQIVTTMDD